MQWRRRRIRPHFRKSIIMSNYKNISIDNDNGIVVLTINRPKALNALNDLTFKELDQAFKHELKDDAQVKAVIITGAGEKAFVAGADIKEFLHIPAGEGSQFSKRGQDVFFAIENFPKLVIAAVNGYALGGGCELAMACHIRVASSQAKFGQPEVNLGILPGYGGTQRLTKLVGRGRAMELILTGDMIDASEAYRIGLVNHVTEPKESISKAKEIAAKVIEKAPRAITESIKAINASESETTNGYDTEYKAFGLLTVSEDFKEGAAAFIEKRKANFKGI